MKCLICGQISLPGAKLCLDCKAARQRAFDATVTKPLFAAAGVARGLATARSRLRKPSHSIPNAGRRAAKMALAAQAQSKIMIESPPRPAGPWPIIVGAICIGVAVGYLGHWFGTGKSDSFAAVPVGRPATQDSPAASSMVRASTPAAIAAPTPVAAIVAATIDVAAAGPTTAATKADATRQPIARSRLGKASTSLPPPESLPPPVVAIAPPPSPPVVREAPRPDRWQLMIEAIARCPRDDISNRVSCEQRLRAQYCEGHWGQVAQCASIPYSDHGQ
jgi:hypothetical protein